MFQNYLKTAIRNLFKNRAVSFINIAGLTLGMTGAVLLILTIGYNASYDQFHKNKDNIYCLYSNMEVNGHLETWPFIPAVLGPALAANYPAIKSVARVVDAGNLIEYGDKKIQSFGSYVDPAFLQLFSFPLVQGNQATVLNHAGDIVVTAQFAHTLFGDADPMNKLVKLNNSSTYRVSGVLQDLPYNSQFKFNYLLPGNFSKDSAGSEASWKQYNTFTYVLLQPGVNVAQLNKSVEQFHRNMSSGSPSHHAPWMLYPFSRSFLWNKFVDGKAEGGRIDNQRMLGILAGVILLIACINFMNLSTARSEKRAREVGVRKVMGAAKYALVIQFIGESLLLAFLSGLLSLLLVQLLLPVYSSLGHVHLQIAWLSPAFWLGAVAFVVFTGVVAGSYPAFYMSSFQPVKVLKGITQSSYALLTPRKVLVIIQFVCAVFLINFTILFRKQINFTAERETGFVKENLLYHPLTADLRKNYPLVKNELLNSGVVTAVSESSTTVTQGGTSVSGLKWEGMDPHNNINFDFITTQENFIKTNGLQLLSGRDIDVEHYPTDTAACVLNETAVKMMGLKNPVGQLLTDDTAHIQIVGVIKDFIIGSPAQVIGPMMIHGATGSNVMNIRLINDPGGQNSRKVEAIIKKYNPNFLTECQFAEEDYAAKFREPQNASTLMNSFALIAIFISCMGLFGLAIYMAENKTREIGIRKVLGASVTGITTLLAKDFIKPVIIAVIIASPLAWLFMNFFLKHFSYRTSLSAWIILVSGAAALSIALFTISFQTIKAAIANPLKNLRTE